MLHSLLFQLVRDCPGLAEEIAPTKSTNIKHHKEIERLMKKLFQDGNAVSSKTCFCFFIDALAECSHPQLEDRQFEDNVVELAKEIKN